jgi:transcriptional regulator with XRE-family HTH domain
MSKGYLSSLETDSGDTKRPSGRTLLKLADALGVTINDLLGRHWITETPNDLPAGLGEFAREARLTEADVSMLTNIKFRGEQPQSKERWAVIYSAIRGSAYLDEESGNRARD